METTTREEFRYCNEADNLEYFDATFIPNRLIRKKKQAKKLTEKQEYGTIPSNEGTSSRRKEARFRHKSQD